MEYDPFLCCFLDRTRLGSLHWDNRNPDVSFFILGNASLGSNGGMIYDSG